MYSFLPVYISYANTALLFSWHTLSIIIALYAFVVTQDSRGQKNYIVTAWASRTDLFEAQLIIIVVYELS